MSPKQSTDAASEEGRRGAGRGAPAIRSNGTRSTGTRSNGTRSNGTTANEAGLAALGTAMQKKTSGHGLHAAPKRRRTAKRVLLICVVVLLLIAGGGAGYTYYLTRGINRVQVRGLSGAFTAGKESGSENILMVGSTDRCALAVQNPAYGICSQGVTGVNSDVIMILHADPARHRLALLSIPRDLFIPNARSNGPNKIDAGLFQGISQLTTAIEEDFGIPIQHAVSLNFDQFANIVQALGGINMSFPMSVFDWGPTGGGVSGDQSVSSGLNQRVAGCVHLDGTQALEVVRARHLRYETPSSNPDDPYAWPQEGQSDLARIRRDHEFLRVLASGISAHGLGNPLSDVNLINSVKSDFTFDQSLSVRDMADLVLDFHSVDIDTVPQLTLPVAQVADPDGAGGGLMYKGFSYGDVEFPSQVQDQATIDEVLGIDATTDAMTGEALPAPAAVTVSVMNGTGVADQATDTSEALGALGFHTVGVGDTTPAGDVAETYVYYGSRAAPTEAAAESIARSMSGAVMMAYDPSMVGDGAQVTVVTGTQFAVNPPTPAAVAGSSTSTPAGSSTSTAAVPSTTTTSTTAPSDATSAAITAPSSPTSSLAPWDPRACAAGAAPNAPVPNST